MKSSSYFLLILLFNFSFVIAEPKIVAHWTFNEGEGDILYDSSGNGYNGKIFNAKWTDGISGKALLFEESESYVKIDSTEPFKLQRYTIIALIKPQKFVDEAQAVFSNIKSPSEISEGIMLGLRDGHVMHSFAYKNNDPSH
ncbi:MAG: hypothetical protein N2053_11295, partial [Chitinispirillaceae bacterium]|nr:hypothetical protein [Chitinispirillaceae bacterium]